MARVISFPFRLDSAATVAKVEQNTDAHVEEQLAVAVSTMPTERILVPTFGVNDPAYVGWERARLIAHVQAFGPDVVVDTVIVTQDDTTETVVVSWSRSATNLADRSSRA